MSDPLLNEFWGCHFDSGGAQVWRNGEKATAPLAFCIVEGELGWSAPEPQGAESVRLTWQANDSPLQLQLLIWLNAPALSWELSATGITQPVSIRLPFLEYTFTGPQPGTVLFSEERFRSLQG